MFGHILLIQKFRMRENASEFRLNNTFVIRASYHHYKIVNIQIGYLDSASPFLHLYALVKKYHFFHAGFINYYHAFRSCFDYFSDYPMGVWKIIRHFCPNPEKAGIAVSRTKIFTVMFLPRAAKIGLMESHGHSGREYEKSGNQNSNAIQKTERNL